MNELTKERPPATATGKDLSWARDHFKGIENILLPSFTPDMKELDEEGIRHDVRMSKKHGFFSVFLAGVGLTPDELVKMIAIVADEAAGELQVAYPAGFEGFDDEQGLVRRASDAGATHMLLHPPFDWKPADEAELEQWYRSMIEAGDLGAVLWATDGWNFRHFAPGNIPINVIDRLADHDKVLAIKPMTTLDEAILFDLCETVYDRLVMGCVNLRMFPIMSKYYGATWSGAWTAEALQSPNKPYIADYVRQMNAGDYDAAVKTYYKLIPAYQALFGMMAPLLPKGVHPFTQLKYYQWFVGGNGGLLRTPHHPLEREFVLTGDQRGAIAEAYQTLGIEKQGPEESFVTGRALFEQGSKPADISGEARRMVAD